MLCQTLHVPGKQKRFSLQSGRNDVRYDVISRFLLHETTFQMVRQRIVGTSIVSIRTFITLVINYN